MQNKIFQFNFFNKEGIKYETIWDVCSHFEAMNFAKIHCEALNDCNSYSFTEHTYLDAENLYDVLNGETIYPAGKMNPTIGDIQKMCYRVHQWFVQPVSLKHIYHTADVDYDNQSTFLPMVLIDENGFVVEFVDGYYRFGMANARGEKEIECLIGFV